MFYKCVYIIIFIILDSNRLTLCDNASYKCGFCAKEHEKLCQITQHTGYSCYKGSSRSPKERRKKYESPKAPMGNDAKNCIPPGVNIDPGYEICCAWSPDTGCNLVLDKQHKGEFCSTCRIKNSAYKDLDICPCTYVSTSGSGQLILSDLRLLIGMAVGFYIMRKISNLLYGPQFHLFTKFPSSVGIYEESKDISRLIPSQK